MENPPSEMNEESIKEESVCIGKESISKHYESKNFPSKFDRSSYKSTNQSANLNAPLKSAIIQRKNLDEKYSHLYKTVEKLKKDFDFEISKINGLRNKSLYLYKLKKHADEWNQKKNSFLEKSRNQQKSHKLDSLNSKMMQKILVSQSKSEMLQIKQASVRNMKTQKSQLIQEFQRNLTEVRTKKTISHKKILDFHQSQDIKKEKLLEEKQISLRKSINAKITEEDKKKEIRVKGIEKLQREELELLRKLRGFHKIHEMSFLEFVDLKSSSLKNYEKKYQKPIQLEPLTS